MVICKPKKLPLKKKMASMETNLASHSFQKKKKRERNYFKKNFNTRLNTIFFFNISRFDDSSNEEPSDPMKYDRIEVNISRGIVNER